MANMHLFPVPNHDVRSGFVVWERFTLDNEYDFYENIVQMPSTPRRKSPLNPVLIPLKMLGRNKIERINFGGEWKYLPNKDFFLFKTNHFRELLESRITKKNRAILEYLLHCGDERVIVWMQW